MAKQCRAKTKKGERCKNEAQFIYCKLHLDKLVNWKTIIGSVVAAMIFLGGIGGFFTDFFFPFKERVSDVINPPTYWQCEQDRNIRGIIMPLTKSSSGDIYMMLGSKSPVFHLNVKGTNGVFENAINLLGGDSFMRIKVTKEHGFVISTDIYDLSGCLAGKVVDNQFVLNKDCQFTWNRDEWGFEVIGPDFEVVFSVEIIKGKKETDLPCVVIQGVFFVNDTFIVLSDKPSDTIKKGEKLKLSKLKKSIKPMFEYFGEDWFGKRKVY